MCQVLRSMSGLNRKQVTARVVVLIFLTTFPIQSSGNALHSGYEIGASDAGGYETFSEEKGPPSPYQFGYKINEDWGQQHRQEQSDGHQVVGSYGYTDAYGLYRQVHYIADQFGFRAEVHTNEPGTANQSPANVKMTSEASQGQATHGYAGDSSQNEHGSQSTEEFNGPQHAHGGILIGSKSSSRKAASSRRRRHSE